MNHHDEHGTHDEQGTKEPGGLGPDGTIPNDPDGLGATTTDEASTFEPEEDEGADEGGAEHGTEPAPEPTSIEAERDAQP